MAYDENLADRIRKALKGKGEIAEKKMFGGLCLLLRGKMCCGVIKDVLVARVDPDDAPALLKQPGVRPMDFTGRPMKGFLYVHQRVLAGPKLSRWLKRCLAFASGLENRPSNSRKQKTRR